MNVHYLPLAEDELDEAFSWYQEHREGLGYEFLDEINATVARISVYPEAYLKVEDELRRALVKRFPYGVIYGIDQKKEIVIVVAICHLHREPFYWVERRIE